MTLKTVLRIIEHYKLLPANQILIIGVSGGTDSLALLHIIVQLRVELGINIHIATLNHGIRGQDSESDVQFVKHIAEQWNISYTIGSVNAPQLAKNENIGLEDAARQVRYQFLADVAQQLDTNYVAVAHHADDQAETILMHIIRGSGLKGLHGMGFSVPMPRHSHITLIRPLLHMTRRELEQYCLENQLTPRHDITNDDIDYQRNFIRHEILPRLRQINPNVVASLSRLGSIARIENDFVTSQFETLVMPFVKQDGQRWTMTLDVFRVLHDALKRRFLLEAFEQLNLSAGALEADQVNRVVQWVGQARVGTELDLGQGIRLRMGYEELYIEHKSYPIEHADYRLIPKDTKIALSIPSHLILKELQIIVSLDASLENESFLHIALPQDLSLGLRTRQKGERFRPDGMRGQSKKVKKWMIDRKIPRQLRDQIPLLTADDQIVAICVGNTWHLADLSQYIVNLNHPIYLALG
jgi:tRNA(Ile)-lysidine synthase